MSTTATPSPKLPTFVQYKLAAVERGRQFGYVETARELRIAKSTIYRWAQKRQAMRAQVLQDAA
jgi:hypothetical protein